MSTLIDHAKSELALLMAQFKASPETIPSDIPMQEDLHNSVLQILYAIDAQGMSGAAFDPIMGMVLCLARQDPLTPVVDAPDQWEKRSDDYLQHKRCSRLVRYVPTGKTIDVEGIKLVERDGSFRTRPNEKITFPFLPSEQYKVGDKLYSTYNEAMEVWSNTPVETK
ncbi:MAG: hypothetical protein WC052_05755 [Patescibacteria group bacterium]